MDHEFFLGVGGVVVKGIKEQGGTNRQSTDVFIFEKLYLNKQWGCCWGFKMPSLKKSDGRIRSQRNSLCLMKWWGPEMREGLHAGTTPFCSARSHLGRNPSFQPVPVARRTCEYGAKGWSTRLMSPQRVSLPLPRQGRQVLFYISAEGSTMF